MIRLARRFFSRPEPSGYICPRCGEYLEHATPEGERDINEHRLIHLADEWGASLDSSTGWTMDEDGGLRPVAD
jgi:hypothetical protein